MEVKDTDTYYLERLFVEGTQIRPDQATIQLRQFIERDLKKIAICPWGELYQDPADERFWEYIEYLDLQGGGPRLLHNVTAASAVSAYSRSWNIANITAKRESLYSLREPSDDDTLFNGIGYVRPISLYMKEKISWLTTQVFEAASVKDKDQLFWDSKRKAYWELVVPEIEPNSLGGGRRAIDDSPCFLHPIDTLTAKKKYPL